MRSPNRRLVEVARVAVELVLATFAAWLVVQNAALILMHPWKETPAPLVVAGALLKVALHLASVVWPWVLVAAPTAAVIVLTLTRNAGRREVRHV
jgi:hypothetical protein